MKVRLTREARYQAAWVFGFKPIPAGTIVPVIPATNMPEDYGECYWVNTPELENDAYGILLKPGDYEHIEGKEKA